MTSRIAIWTVFGALVVIAWRVYISTTLSDPLGSGGIGQALIYLTCPIAMASAPPQGFYSILLVNAVTYGLVGLIVETTRRYCHLSSSPN